MDNDNAGTSEMKHSELLFFKFNLFLSCILTPSSFWE